MHKIDLQAAINFTMQGEGRALADPDVSRWLHGKRSWSAVRSEKGASAAGSQASGLVSRASGREPTQSALMPNEIARRGEHPARSQWQNSAGNDDKHVRFRLGPSDADVLRSRIDTLSATRREARQARRAEQRRAEDDEDAASIARGRAPDYTTLSLYFVVWSLVVFGILTTDVVGKQLRLAARPIMILYAIPATLAVLVVVVEFFQNRLSNFRRRGDDDDDDDDETDASTDADDTDDGDTD